jgi:protoheme ferro-lyase
MGIRGRETFLTAGGEAFQLIPSLNDDAGWIHAVVSRIREVDSAKDASATKPQE